MALSFHEAIDLFKETLSTLAGKHLPFKRDLRARFWLKQNFLLLALGEMTLRITGSEPRCDDDVRALLFEPAAFELLTGKCPNEFWFFEILNEVRISGFPISAQEVGSAVARARRELLNRHDTSFLTGWGKTPHPPEGVRCESVFPLHREGLLLCAGPKLDWSTLIVHPLIQED